MVTFHNIKKKNKLNITIIDIVRTTCPFSRVHIDISISFIMILIYIYVFFFLDSKNTINPHGLLASRLFVVYGVYSLEKEATQ